MTESSEWSALQAGSWSETGLRSRNEDSLAVLVQLGVLIIADGMGGHAHGEAASHEAVEAAIEVLKRAAVPAEALAEAILAAQAQVSSHRDNRGTTLTLAALKDGILHIAHVGDTRAYVNGRQVTRDQGIGHVLEEFVGGDYAPLVQFHRTPAPPGTWVMLSTDGIHDVLPIEHLFPQTVDACGRDPQLTAKMLALASVHAGSSDNCSAIVALVGGPPRTPHADDSTKGTGK